EPISWRLNLDALHVEEPHPRLLCWRSLQPEPLDDAIGSSVTATARVGPRRAPNSGFHQARSWSPNCLQNWGAIGGTREEKRGTRDAIQLPDPTGETTNWRAPSPDYVCSGSAGSIPMRYRQILDLTSVS